MRASRKKYTNSRQLIWIIFFCVNPDCQNVIVRNIDRMTFNFGYAQKICCLLIFFKIPLTIRSSLWSCSLPLAEETLYCQLYMLPRFGWKTSINLNETHPANISTWRVWVLDRILKFPKKAFLIIFVIWCNLSNDLVKIKINVFAETSPNNFPMKPKHWSSKIRWELQNHHDNHSRR